MGGTHQQLFRMSEGKFFVVRSQLNGLVLDVQNNEASPGNMVALWEYNGGLNQLFYEDYINGCIRSALDDNYVLEVQGDKLVVNEFHPDEYNQRWCLQGEHMAHRDNPSQVLDVADCNCDPGARICSWEHNGGSNQQWIFEYQEPRFCYIRSVMNDRVVDIKGEEDAAGVKVMTYEQNDSMTDNQLWYEDRYGCIRSKMGDWAIDTHGDYAVTNHYDPGWFSMQWVKNGLRISNRMDPNQCLDIKGAKDKNGAKLIPYEYHGADNQHWIFE